MPIRPAIRLSALPRTQPLHERLLIARGAGFEGVEVEVGDAPAAELRAAADEAGLAVQSIHCFENYTWPLSSPDPAVRDAGIAATVAALEAGRIMGAETLLLIPGIVGADATYGEVYTRSQAVIRSDLLPEAERRGIAICVENVWNGFLLSPYDCARYIDSFETPFVRLYLDVGNIVFGRPEGWIDIAGHCIGALHLKDLRHWHRLRRYQVTRVGDGDIDWRRVRDALARAGFSGWGVMAEAESAQPFWPRLTFNVARRFAETICANPVSTLVETGMSRWIAADAMRRFRRHVAPSGAPATAG